MHYLTLSLRAYAFSFLLEEVMSLENNNAVILGDYLWGYLGGYFWKIIMLF